VQTSKPLVESAALIPIYRDAAGDLRVVLIRRGAGGVHGGHLAFPGGKRDHEDASFAATAVREAWEEIGLPPADTEVLAELPHIDTRTSGFRIYPILARIRRPTAWVPCEREVAEIVEPRIVDLARAEAHVTAVTYAVSANDAPRVPFYRVGAHQLWGASYRIFHPLLPRLMAGEWPV
jgi:8-oxo-dGTP pyrophosphatase MutT (NUDIX family)